MLDILILAIAINGSIIWGIVTYLLYRKINIQIKHKEIFMEENCPINPKYFKLIDYFSKED